MPIDWQACVPSRPEAVLVWSDGTEDSINGFLLRAPAGGGWSTRVLTGENDGFGEG